MSHDYIPKNDDELLVFTENLYAYALANYTRWQVPSPQAFLEAPIAAYKTALTAYQDPNHGKIDTLNKNETKKTLDSACAYENEGGKRGTWSDVVSVIIA
jgi:hypothetical protein